MRSNFILLTHLFLITYFSSYVVGNIIYEFLLNTTCVFSNKNIHGCSFIVVKLLLRTYRIERTMWKYLKC